MNTIVNALCVFINLTATPWGRNYYYPDFPVRKRKHSAARFSRIGRKQSVRVLKCQWLWAPQVLIEIVVQKIGKCWGSNVEFPTGWGRGMCEEEAVGWMSPTHTYIWLCTNTWKACEQEFSWFNCSVSLTCKEIQTTTVRCDSWGVFWSLWFSWRQHLHIDFFFLPEASLIELSLIGFFVCFSFVTLLISVSFLLPLTS